MSENRITTKQPDILDQIIDGTRDSGISVNNGAVGFQSFTGLAVLSKIIFDSGLCPASMDSSKKVLVAIARGHSLGLDPFQSLESFYVVNGIATLYGNAPLALARQHPDWQESGFDEWFEDDGQRINGHPSKWDRDSITAVCQTQRKGAQPKLSHFSVADAKKAGLWDHPKKLYKVYPFRMLAARARGYAIQDNFGDSLKGIQIRETFDEEVDGKPPVENGAATITKKMEEKKKTFEVRNNRPSEVDNNSAAIKEAVKQSFPEKVEVTPITQEEYDKENSEIDMARDILKGIYGRIPIKQNPIECLKKASMEDGTWISFEHIDSISDVDYLNRIAARLEEFSAMGAKA